MAVTLATLRARTGEFSATSDAAVQAAIDEAERSTNRTAYGAKADDAVIYLAAHLLTLDAMTSPPPGAVASQSIGGASVSYVAPRVPIAGDRGATKWGRRRAALSAFASRVV
jgi:hypothetical protein